MTNPPDAPDTATLKHALATLNPHPAEASCACAFCWNYRRAKGSVLDLFERLQKENAELKRMLAGFDVDRVEEEHGITEGQLAALRSENETLSSLRSSSLGGR